MSIKIRSLRERSILNRPSIWKHDRGLSPIPQESQKVRTKKKEIDPPGTLTNSKPFRDYVRQYGLDVTHKYVLPCIYDIIKIAVTSNRKKLRMCKKEAFTFFYLLNDIDVSKGRLRLHGDICRRIRTFYYNARSRQIDIPVFMGLDRKKGELLDMKGKSKRNAHIFLFHERIKNLTPKHDVEVTVGFSGIGLRVV